jgi:predicted SnoaL-like aldol condensation-catalyzing enzyme
VSSNPDPAEVVRSYFHRLFAERDLTACDDLLAPDYVDHDAPPDTPPGPAATKAYVAQMLRRWPDLRVELHEVQADGRAVTVRATWRGTDAATGATWTQAGVLLIRVGDGGQLVERWSAYH